MKSDRRKKVKLTIETTIQDIEKLEDFWSTIPLCKAHKGARIAFSERELMTKYYVCKECEKVYRKLNDAARRIEGALSCEYLKRFSE